MCESVHLNPGRASAHLNPAGLLGNALVNATTSGSTPLTSSSSPIPSTSSSGRPPSASLSVTPPRCVGSPCAATGPSRRNSSSSSLSSSLSSSSSSSLSSASSSCSAMTITSLASTMGTSSSSALDFDIGIDSAVLGPANTSIPYSAMEKAGCVPVRRRMRNINIHSGNHTLGAHHGGLWEVMLVQSLGTPCRWAFPKGSVEPGETPSDAAVRETAEEGGVFGHLGPNLGTWTLKRNRLKFQSMWLLVVHTECASDSILWKEAARRARVWLSFDAARALLSRTPPHARRPELLEMLDAAQAALNVPVPTCPRRSLLTLPPDDDT